MEDTEASVCHTSGVIPLYLWNNQGAVPGYQGNIYTRPGVMFLKATKGY